MKIISSSFTLIFVIILTFVAWVSSYEKHEDFLRCLSHHSQNDSISEVIHTLSDSSYSSILNFSIRNLRFSTANTPKPQVIITPSKISHIQASVICSKNHGLQIRTRSGGHDFEGGSSVSDIPFIIVDLINIRSIIVDTKNKTAWVQSGATHGELYYNIAQKSPTLAFPGGIGHTVGVGGLFSGGGYGGLLRKYGLAADNVIDAYLVDAKGNLLSRKSMGEDLFWAIRGGGGGSFGIVVAWKIKLVYVPPTVTVFNIRRPLDGNTAKIIHRWQYVANKIDENLYIGIQVINSVLGTNSSMQGGKRTRTVQALFYSLYLGKADELLSIVEKSFPELGLVEKDCVEMSWIESVLNLDGFTNGEPLELLLRRTPPLLVNFKGKADYVKKPIPETGLEGLWKWLKTGDFELTKIEMTPYGGKMSEISKSEIPFPHRSGNLFIVGYQVGWREQGVDAIERHLNWSRCLYNYMTPFVSKSPRAAYVNYKDLDIGTNNKYGEATSYKQASIWGQKYFGNNFKRLVQVKTKVDPCNFFRHEQSVPSLVSCSRKEENYAFSSI